MWTISSKCVHFGMNFKFEYVINYLVFAVLCLLWKWWRENQPASADTYTAACRVLVSKLCQKLVTLSSSSSSATSCLCIEQRRPLNSDTRRSARAEPRVYLSDVRNWGAPSPANDPPPLFFSPLIGSDFFLHRFYSDRRWEPQGALGWDTAPPRSSSELLGYVMKIRGSKGVLSVSNHWLRVSQRYTVVILQIPSMISANLLTISVIVHGNSPFVGIELIYKFSIKRNHEFKR